MNKLLLVVPILLVLVVPLAFGDSHEIPKDQPEEEEDNYNYDPQPEPEPQSGALTAQDRLEMENEQLKEEIINLKTENEQLILQNISLQDEIDALKDQIGSMADEFMENIQMANEWFRSQLAN